MSRDRIEDDRDVRAALAWLSYGRMSSSNFLLLMLAR